jgi:hypothetical protein
MQLTPRDLTGAYKPDEQSEFYLPGQEPSSTRPSQALRPAVDSATDEDEGEGDEEDDYPADKKASRSPRAPPKVPKDAEQRRAPAHGHHAAPPAPPPKREGGAVEGFKSLVDDMDPQSLELVLDMAQLMKHAAS